MADVTTSIDIPARSSAFTRAAIVMWRRQLIRFWRAPSRVVAALAQPILFLFAAGFGFNAIFEQAGHGSYIEFVGPGIIGMSIIFTSVYSGMEVLFDRRFGFLKETLVAPVPRSAIMIGRTLGGTTVSVAQGLLILIMTLIVGFRPENWALVPAAIVVMALISIMFTAFGTLVATRLKDFQGFPLVMNLIIMPLFFLSGALFPIDGLPAAMLWLVHANPLGYGIDTLRHLLIGEGYYNFWLDLGVVIALSTVLLTLGAWFFRKIEA